MVILNTAEAELDETLGELIVKSRHRLENDQMIAIRKSGASNNSKCPRIVGAVSLLLIQPCCMEVNDNGRFVNFILNPSLYIQVEGRKHSNSSQPFRPNIGLFHIQKTVTIVTAIQISSI